MGFAVKAAGRSGFTLSSAARCEATHNLLRARPNPGTGQQLWVNRIAAFRGRSNGRQRWVEAQLLAYFEELPVASSGLTGIVYPPCAFSQS